MFICEACGNEVIDGTEPIPLDAEIAAIMEVSPTARVCIWCQLNVAVEFGDEPVIEGHA